MVIRNFPSSRHLGFGETGSRSIRTAVPENPTLGSNTKLIGRPVPEIWPFEIFQDVRVGRRDAVTETLYPSS